MKRFNFPFAYEPKVNLKDTILYSSILKQQMIDYLINRFKCIYVDPAIIVDNKKSALAYQFGDRIMSFDNKINNSIFCLNSTQDNYLTLLSSTLKNENIVMFSPMIHRDATQTNLDSIINWEMNVELSMPINLNMEYFITLAKEVFYSILEIVKQPKLSKIHTIARKKTEFKDFTIVNSQKIESSYPTLSLEEAFAHFCSQNKFVIVQHNIRKLKSGKSLEQFVPTAQDIDLSCGLYVYDSINNKPIHLISICKRPDGYMSNKQLNDTNPIELTNELYDEKLFSKHRPTNISLSINFTNLLFYLLDKVHLSEVVKSVWPDDFIEFTKTEKIEIF